MNTLVIHLIAHERRRDMLAKADQQRMRRHVSRGRRGGKEGAR
jgi:hypothetical protein